MAISTKTFLKAREVYGMGHFKMYYALEGGRLVRSLEERKLVEDAMETLKEAKIDNARNVDKEGVHRTHCCVAHGCKYGDRDCPVETGKIKQDYVCEYCEHDGIDNLEDLQKYVMRSMNDEHPLVSEENYVKLYGAPPVTDLTEKVPVSLELLQRVWTELYRSPETECEHAAFQTTLEDIVDLLDKWDALPELEDD